jgi:hypothetical protein
MIVILLCEQKQQDLYIQGYLKYLIGQCQVHIQLSYKKAYHQSIKTIQSTNLFLLILIIIYRLKDENSHRIFIDFNSIKLSRMTL